LRRQNFYLLDFDRQLVQLVLKVEKSIRKSRKIGRRFLFKQAFKGKRHGATGDTGEYAQLLKAVAL
jgi:hypothetical protein